jgi:NADH-quinone oxidoreductase subunit J
MLAGIYLTLSAEFIAVVQIIVYAGAIMVLVLFVIMLLNIGDEESAKKRKNRIKQYFSVTISTALLVLIISYIVLANTDYQYHNASIFNTLTQQSGSVKAVGEELFTNFLIPLEAVGILLLTAIIGSVILAKKRLN